MVFGNNTASDISKLSKILRAAKWRVVFGNFWNITRRYYCQILGAGHAIICLIDAEKFFERPFFYGWKKQTQASTFVTIFLRQWKKWLAVFCETSTNHSRQTTWNSSMKVSYKSRLLRSLQRWYNKATFGNSDAIKQSNLRNFSAYIINVKAWPLTSSCCPWLKK